MIGPRGYPEGMECAIEAMVVNDVQPGLIQFRVHYGSDTEARWSEVITYSGRYSIFWSQ